MPMNDLTADSRLNNAGSKESIPAAKFNQETLKANTEVTVFAEEVKQDQNLYHGYGVREREFAEAFTGLDLVASGNGSGTAGAKIDGEVILAITDSEQKRVLASTTFDTLGELRDSLKENRSERIVEPAMSPYGTPGRYLEIRVEAYSGSDGAEIDPASSSGKLYYGKVQG